MHSFCNFNHYLHLFEGKQHKDLRNICTPELVQQQHTHLGNIFSNFSTNSTLCVNLTNNYTFCLKVAQRCVHFTNNHTFLHRKAVAPNINSGSLVSLVSPILQVSAFLRALKLQNIRPLKLLCFFDFRQGSQIQDCHGQGR